jgi:hypothetical protein
MKLGLDISSGMINKNGFVPNVGKLFVFINQHAFLVDINGIRKTVQRITSLDFCSAALQKNIECIEDNGDYKRIVERMVEMAQGSLPLENIQDHVDLEKETAWFSFTFSFA